MKNYFSKLLRFLGLAGVCTAMLCTVAYGEGSKELTVHGNGHRPYTEFDTNELSGITRQTVLSVYAEEGEEILLGTSQWDSYDGNDIVVTSPSGSVTNIDVRAPYRQYWGVNNWTYYDGHIATKAMEQAGPSYNGQNPGGYAPYVYNANETGIYTVCFHGQTATGENQNPPMSLLTDGGWRDPGEDANYKFQPEQTGYDIWPGFDKEDSTYATVAAWDISVYKNGTYIPGRVFTKSLSLNTGDDEGKVYSSVYVLTSDGYTYKTDLNGIEPWGFVFYANNRGLVDQTSGRTVYKNAVANAGASASELGELVGNIVAPRPSSTDVGNNRTYNIFFNEPAEDLPASMPTTPQPSATFDIVSIVSNATGMENETPEGAGFRANVKFSKACTYTMVVDVNQNGQYDPGTDDVIRDAASEGENSIIWDGGDGNGSIVPADTNVNIIIYVKAGEMHVPFIDVERNPNGIKFELVNGDDNVVSGYTNNVYYDNRSYTTADGTAVALTDAAMNPSYHNDEGKQSPSGGASGTAGVGAYSDDYGNNKVIDYWTYVRGYDDRTEAQTNNSTYLKSDGVNSSVYEVAKNLKILPADTKYGIINGYIYYDSNSNGTYDAEEDVDFTVDFPVTVVSSSVSAGGQYHTTSTKGRFSIAIPLDSNGSAEYECYIIVPENMEEYVKNGTIKITTEGKKFIDVKIDEDNNIVETGTDKKAIYFKGSVNIEDTNENVGIALSDLPEVYVSVDVDKYDVAVGDNITYTVKVTNNTNIDVTNARLNINIPAGHTYVSANGSGSYDNSTGLWRIGDIGYGSAELNITVTANTAGNYTIAAKDFKAFNYDSQNSVTTAERNYTVHDESQGQLQEPVFEYTEAKLTKDNEILVVGKPVENVTA